MKRFLLIIFGNFTDISICKEIALSLSPIVDSPHLKFQFSKGVCIFHFATETPQTEIHNYIISLVTDDDIPFILTEMNDKVSVSMKQNVYEHLMNLKSDEGSDVKLKEDNFLPDVNHIVNDEDEEQNLASLLNLISQNKKPSLNSILDKISETGIDSLTEFEKEVLSEYSKI